MMLFHTCITAWDVVQATYTVNSLRYFIHDSESLHGIWQEQQNWKPWKKDRRMRPRSRSPAVRSPRRRLKPSRWNNQLTKVKLPQSRNPVILSLHLKSGETLTTNMLQQDQSKKGWGQCVCEREKERDRE